MILADRFHYPPDYEDRYLSLLDKAFTHVPLYRQWQQALPSQLDSWTANLDGLPVLTKADMRTQFPLGLMPDWQSLDAGLRSEAIEYTFTSGTTAEKVVNIWDQDWWNRSEVASWKLNSKLAALSYPQKQAKLASSLNVGINCEEDLPFSHRVLGNTLYLNEKTSVLQWQPRHLKRMIDELNDFQPVILEANPSLLARLAYWAVDHQMSVFSPQSIIFTFEFPSAIHLAAIQQVFSSNLVSSYGTTETGFVMEQCEHGLMHQNTDFCRIDFVPLKPEHGGPQLGRIFVTTFDNPWNWIIRFDVGDLVRLHGDGSCQCGRSQGMIVEAVEGRVGNVMFATDGRLVTTKELDDNLAQIGFVRDYHLAQQSRSEYLLEVTLAPDAEHNSTKDRLLAGLQSVFGYDGSYDIQIVADILPGPAGKYRRTQADFDFDESRLFL